MSSIKTKFFNFIFLFILLFIFLISIKAFDSVLGILTGEKPSIYGNERYIHLREHSPFSEIYPPEDVCKDLSEADKRNNFLLLDKNGLIQNEAVKDNEVEIIFFGGSTTENLCISKEKRFPNLVSAILKEKTGRNINVYNAGVSGNHALHSLLSFQAKGIKLKPDLVIFMHGINDLSLLSKTYSYWEAPRTREIIITKTQKDMFIDLTKSLLNSFLPNTRSFINKIRRNNQVKIDEFALYREGRKLDAYQAETIKSEFRSAIISLIQISKSWNTQPILLTQPNRFSRSDDEIISLYNSKSPNIDYFIFIELYKEFNKIIKEVAINYEVPIIDLESKVPKNKDYFYDSVHLNGKGNMFVAEVISNSLESSLQDIP